MSWYFFYQTNEKEPWQIGLASDRQRIVNEVKPFLTSVLDTDYDFKQDLSYEEQAKVRYLGPVYFDLDVSDGYGIGDVILKFQEFLALLRSKGVDLNTLRLFATGGKGFHVEMPLETVKDKVPKNGITGLPYILKEFAYDLYCDFMDLRVYTGKRGRLWRTPNILRPNGKYKVPVTPYEVFSMTEESYGEICSAPRPMPSVEPAKFNPTLAVLFSIAEDKVASSVKKRKSGKADAALIKQFNGEWPDTVRKIMAGDGLVDGIGFQRIAMQLAIAAHALGKSEKDLLRESEGLCDKHQSDGSRYNTFKKRQHEIARMFQYMAGNPCYEFSIGSLKALMNPEADTSDLSMGTYVPEDDEGVSEDGDGDAAPEIGSVVRINKGGFFVKEEHGFRKVSDIGIGNPLQLVKVDDGRVIGYEVNAFVEGRDLGAYSITMSNMQTKARFMEWASGICSVSVQASDSQVSMLMDLLRRRSDKDDKRMWVVTREGVDVIVPYGAKDVKAERDIIWAARDQVISFQNWQYRLRGHMDRSEQKKSDLHHAPMMTDTPKMREVLDSLFEVNSKSNTALLLGWFFSAFICQLIRKGTGQYPSLQVFGPMGAGKTQTIKALLWMHTYLSELGILMASTASTNFSIMAALSQSASIPVVFDEVKPRDMTKERANYLRDVTRNNYTAAELTRGSVNRDAGSSTLEVIRMYNGGPLVFIGEALETESAILERCIKVPLTKESRAGREIHHQTLIDNHELLSTLGRTCLDFAVHRIDIEILRDDIRAYRRRVVDSLGGTAFGRDRPAHNIAVVLAGLKFGKIVVGSVFGTDYDEHFQEFEDVLLSHTIDVVPDDISEAAKVLDMLAQMSYGTGDDATGLVYGKDYTVSPDGSTVDIVLKSCYNKYTRHCRSLGQAVLYDNIGAFLMGMRHYGGVLATTCPDNAALQTNPLVQCFRFSTEIMAREKVEPFRRI